MKSYNITFATVKLWEQDFMKRQEPAVRKLKEPILDDIASALIWHHGLNFMRQDNSLICSFYVNRGDEEYLYVDGIGIKTGDFFQFYYSDPNTALASLTKVHDALKNIKLERNSKDFKGDGDSATNVFGGLIFACYGRGESFFGRNNVDSSPFLENFPGVPVSGIFCGGEMVRPCTTVIGQCQGASPISCCLHVYSTVYLAMSYTPPSVED